MIRRALVFAFVGGACGGHYSTGPTTPAKPGPGGPAGGIEAAALPYQIIDARTGRAVETEAFWSKAAAARAICVGEDHPNPHHHWVQLEAVKQLGHRLGGAKLALGMEMVQRPFQGVLDDFAGKHIDEAAMRSRVGWSDRWGYDYVLYGPTIVAAVGEGAQLLALNASDELRKKISHHGLESLTPDERAQVPELKLDDAAHRSWFDALMEDMGGSSAHSQSKSRGAKDDARDDADSSAGRPAPGHGGDPGDEMPSADRVYTVQVIWDETMADTGARWLAANPGGHLILLAGNGHCHDSAIIDRLKRRGVADAISVRGVIDDGEGSVGEALARPVNDFLVVLQMPPDVQRADKADDKADDKHKDDTDKDDKPAK